MNDRFDAVEFLRYLRANWRGLLITCGVAAVLALSVSLAVDKRYTAVSTILIQPPAGMDPRSATAVSPVYLESLKTYELLASSDSLFLDALEHLHIRAKYAGRSIESLKRSVLAVAKPLNTRVIEISTTLPDPKEAQQLAQYLAERTVALSRSMDEQAASDASRQSQGIFDSAQARLSSARKALEDYNAHYSDAAASSDVASANELKYDIERDLFSARASLAELTEQRPASGSQDWVARDIASARARVTSLGAQLTSLAATLKEKGALSDRLKQRRDFLEGELKSSWASFDAAIRKRDDTKASVSFQGERLMVLDPGIVPQRPSSPNIPLNVMGSILVALVASVLWLAVRFGLGGRSATRRPEYMLR
ncbi:MAG TPA: hypothetical protein VNH18_00175 [Bryobacteraceae bacterium]|nr:hypothetical protein [Bryobacteraceae bacterium]